MGNGLNLCRGSRDWRESDSTYMGSLMKTVRMNGEDSN